MKYVGFVIEHGCEEKDGEFGNYNMLNELRRNGRIKGFFDVVSYQKNRIYKDEIMKVKIDEQITPSHPC